MENSTENKYKFSKITDKQLKAQGVQALADRPNAVGQYGQSGLSPAQLKQWFDNFAWTLAGHINLIQEAINGEEAAKYIGLKLGEYTTLDALIAAMQDGRFAGEILGVFPSAGERGDEHLTALQAVIDDFAKDISELNENKLDKKKPGVLSAYTVGADNENGTVEISEKEAPGAIPQYNALGELRTAVPTGPYSAMNLLFFKNYMKEMAKHIGAGVTFTMNPDTFVVTVNVLDDAGNSIYETYLDLPLEEMIVHIDYEDGNVIFTLKSGQKTVVPVAEIVGGIVTDAKHNADKKELNDKINRLFGEYVEEIDELVGGDFVDYSE